MVFCFVIAFLSSFSHADEPGPKYYEYRPREPRVRWFNNGEPEIGTSWKLNYSVNNQELVIGGRHLSARNKGWKIQKKDHQGSCSVMTGFEPIATEEISLCMVKELFERPSVQVNSQEMSPEGSIEIAENNAFTIEARVPPKSILKIHFLYPKVRSQDLRVFNGKKQMVYRVDDKKIRKTATFWSFSFPIPERLIAANLKSSDVFERKSPAGISFYKPLVALEPWPQESDRPRLRQRRTLGTYKEKINFSVRGADNKKFAIQANGLVDGRWNRRTFELSLRKWDYDVLRMYPSEVSGRGSAVLGPGGSVILLSDITVSRYLESLGGDFDSFWSHRIGFRVRGFSSLATLGGDGSLKMGAISGEARLGIRPGLWNFDELVGLILAGSQMRVEESMQSSFGLGFYWARPLPLVFDKVLNLVPIFRFPKYVDMDFTYFGMDMELKSRNPSSVLNFHGKMIFTERWFFELGFGLTNSVIEDYAQNTRRTFNFFSMTSGFGYLF